MRLVSADVVLQRLFFVFGNIRRVADHDVERLVLSNGAKEVAGQEADAIEHVMALCVFPGDGQGRVAQVGGRDLRRRDD